MKKKYIFTGLASIIPIALLLTMWHVWCSTTRVAFVHYSVIEMGQMAKANTNPRIKITEVGTDELNKLKNCDMVIINAMGLRITEEEREQLRHIADDVPVLSIMATNPDNKIVSLDSIQADTLLQYLYNGGRRNYRSMLNYIRKYIDRKKFFSVIEPEAVVESANDLIYHPDADHPEEEDLGFAGVAEYHDYLSRHGLMQNDTAAQIIVTGSLGTMPQLVIALEQAGHRVYPVRSIIKFIRDHHADSIRPAAIINMAHGRLGDEMVKYLTRQNIPLFSPLNVSQPVEKWEEDKMGMSGGFLSQSVVMPEIDGALRTFALYGNYKDEEGLQYTAAIPDRLETYVRMVGNYIRLGRKPNSQKRVAIYYYKGPGQNGMTAGGMEVGPSLYNLLVRLRNAGYKVDGLPDSPKDLERLIQSQGAVFGAYAQGAFDEFMKSGSPELITKTQYESWVRQTLRPEKYAEVVAVNGDFPGQYMSTPDGKLGVARVQLGNVVLLPQNAAGTGSNSFKVVHGTDAAPPHTYIASYLWTQYGFKADALIHFGTHGSLEFTPRKQVALSALDWPDRLVGALPHFYIYTIGNVGEGMIAKRRSYAGLQSYLTPPFLNSGLRGTYAQLMERIKTYNHEAGGCTCGAHDTDHKSDPVKLKHASLRVKELAMKMGIHRELELDSIAGKPYTEEDILRIENFAEEIATEKITGQLYTLGIPYEPQRITSSVYAMSADPIAYSLLALDKLRKRAGAEVLKHQSVFTTRYLEPAHALVGRLLTNPALATDELLCTVADIKPEELQKAREVEASRHAPQGMMAMMMGGGSMKGKEKKEYTKDEIAFALTIAEVERTIKNIGNYKRDLQQSPETELISMLNALNGGYTPPSPGGDPIANPNTLPTGRNLYGINAEATPGEAAWEKGIQLANNTIEMYRRRHNDSIPRKVSYTLWSGEFIETEGATIAQILYMLGVEPIRDAFGRVSDLRLIPSKELGRPRIDVVVQTSGQLRDLAASRLFLINRAVEMAAQAKDEEYENQVAAGVVEAERLLIEKGLSPKDAREISTFRVFGGVNGNYGTGIQRMVMSGDKWETEKEIADTYLNNMGAYYGSEKNWEVFLKFAFEAALTRTDVVIQPRQSNTWGALSLDHVYEFMGGLNLAVRNVTGKDPDAYLSDYRNRNRVRMQEVKEAIGVESRTTIFNPNYIQEQLKGGAGAAGGFAAIVQNTYAWNVMKPKAIDRELWDEIYEVYVQDKYKLGLHEFFERESPAALEEITAVMLETVRKGMWKANAEQIAAITHLHTDLVKKHAPSCSGFVCDNAKLRDFIASHSDASTAREYRNRIKDIREKISATGKNALVMKKESNEAQSTQQTDEHNMRRVVIITVCILILLLILLVYRRRQKRRHS